MRIIYSTGTGTIKKLFQSQWSHPEISQYNNVVNQQTKAKQAVYYVWLILRKIHTIWRDRYQLVNRVRQKFVMKSIKTHFTKDIA